MNYKERTEKHIEELIANELAAANEKNPAFASMHEGYAVLKEEIEEVGDELDETRERLDTLWAGIRCDEPYGELEDIIDDIRTNAVNIIEEAIQVAAMCDKFMALDVPKNNVRWDNPIDTGAMGEFYKNWAKREDEKGDKVIEMLKTPIIGKGKTITFRKYDPLVKTDPIKDDDVIGLDDHGHIVNKTHPAPAVGKITWTAEEYEKYAKYLVKPEINLVHDNLEAGDPLKWQARIAEEDLEAFNKNNLSQKLKNRCKDCGWLHGDVACGFHSRHVEKDWTCNMWKTKEPETKV